MLAALDATDALSKAAMWEMRGPIDAGHIVEGRELGRVLWSHCATYEKVTGVETRMSQSGTEPLLATETRTRLFSIAHNALTNALLHPVQEWSRSGLGSIRTESSSRSTTTARAFPRTTPGGAGAVAG